MALQSFRSVSNPNNHVVKLDGVVVGRYGEIPFSATEGEWVEEPYVPLIQQVQPTRRPGSKSVYDHYLSRGLSAEKASELSNYTP